MIEVEVEDRRWPKVAKEAAFEAASRAAGGLANERSVVVLLAGDERVRALNKRFRGKDEPTNVLAFPAPPTASGTLGDVVLAFGVCEREALDQGRVVVDHMCHLVVHGVLHLLGHDHQNPAEADAMEAVEIAILAGLGIANPYSGTCGQDDHAQPR